MYIEPRDFVKLGQVAVGKGRWLDQQVVSPEWMERSTSALVKVDNRDYGYCWWIQDYPYRGRTVRAAFAGGNGGQTPGRTGARDTSCRPCYKTHLNWQQHLATDLDGRGLDSTSRATAPRAP